MPPSNKGDRPRSAPPTEPIPDHPAISAYQSAFGRTPNAIQAKQISETVTDPVVWQQVLTDWQANGWKENGVAKMLDRYCKATGAAPAEAATPPTFCPSTTTPTSRTNNVIAGLTASTTRLLLPRSTRYSPVCTRNIRCHLPNHLSQ